MKRILLATAIVLAAGAFLVLAGGASNSSPVGTYKIEFDNAFGLISGADFRVAGVNAGKIGSVDLDQRTLHALVTVNVTQGGFGQFRSDAFCQSRPQSLIGEYFIECQPGQYGQVLKNGSTIPVTRTQSTIPADLLQNVMRMPYRQRFTLIINELGAAVAGRSEDLKLALRRAVPALTQTDNLLNLLANDSHTLQQLTSSSDAVITALANNSSQVQRFIREAGHTAAVTATQQVALRGTFQKLPGFFQQLRPSLAQLSAATDANTPVLANLNAAAGQLNRLFTDLPGFSRSSLPAFRSLGQASVTGKVAVTAATPTIRDLNAFATPTPELAQNLAIVLHDLDNRARAVEADTRSPGGKGYTGLEALLQYVFTVPLSLNSFGPFGHVLAIDLLPDSKCAPYTNREVAAQMLAKYGPSYRQCYAWLGPNQPGLSTPDPTNPTACVPDPGGAPPGERGLPATACKLTAPVAATARVAGSAGAAGSGQGGATPSSPTTPAAPTSQPSPPSPGGAPGSGQTLGQILTGALGGGSGGAAQPSAPSGARTQQLLNYLLAP